MDEFRLDDQQGGAMGFEQKKPLLVRLVLGTGMVSTDRQAEYVLLGIAILGILIAGFVLYSGSAKNHPSQAQLEEAGRYLETYGSSDTFTQ